MTDCRWNVTAMDGMGNPLVALPEAAFERVAVGQSTPVRLLTPEQKPAATPRP